MPPTSYPTIKIRAQISCYLAPEPSHYQEKIVREEATTLPTTYYLLPTTYYLLLPYYLLYNCPAAYS
jgi:hypothetical protein